MKYCAKCGKQITDEATVCLHCGCAVEKKQPSYAEILARCVPGSSDPVIKQDIGMLWLVSMAVGLGFGFVMGMIAIPILGLLSGLLFGALFALAMQIATSILEKKWASKRAEISAATTIVVEGAANLDGNGGWLFITQKGMEYYTHKLNFDRRTLIFSSADIQSIRKEGKKLVIIAGNTKYVFVVNYVDRWLQRIQGNHI